MKDYNKDLLEYGFSNPLYPNAISINTEDLWNRGKTKMELEVKEHIELDDGKYEGKIVAVDTRQVEGQSYYYTDVIIEEKETQLKLKYGCPSDITGKTKLGQLLMEFTTLDVGSKIDPKDILIGKKVSFMTMKKKTDKGEFTNIVSNSVKKL